MTKKLYQSQQEKVKTGFWSLGQNKILSLLFYLLILFLPVQVGKHFWPNFSFVFGLRLDYLSPTLYLTDILIVLIILFSVTRLKDFVLKVNKKNWLFFCLLLISLLVGVVWSKNPLAGFYGIIKVLEYFLLAIVLKISFKNFNKHILFFCFLTGIIFESLLAFLQYFNQGSIGGIFYFFGERAFNAQTPGIANASINGQLFLRPYATFSHPNILAAFLVVAMLYLFMFFKNRIILSLGIILGTITLLLTLSRTAIFLWVIYLIVLFGIPLVKKYKNRFPNMKLSISLLALLISVIVTYVVFQNSFIFQRFFLTKITDESFSQRLFLTQQSLVMFSKHPLFGVGINNFFDNLSFTNSQLSVLLIQPVHNIFLLILSEIGIIGFCFFIYLFYLSLKNLIKLKFTKERKYLLMIVFTVIFLGFFDHYFLTIQQGQILMALIFGIVFSYGKS
jgi:O-antigen ligase